MAGIFAVGFFAVRIRCRNFLRRILCRMVFSPYGHSAVRSFRRQDFSPYRNFVVWNFRRMEFSPCGSFTAQNFRRNASFEGIYVVFKFHKTKFIFIETISFIDGSVRKLNILWIQERPCVHSVQYCSVCVCYLDTYVYAYIYWKLWKSWLVTLKCAWFWMFKTC